METIYQSAAEWFICHGGMERCHSLFSVPGISGLNVMVDGMHGLDMGLTHHCLGNTLFVMCWRDRYLGPRLSPSQRLERICDRIQLQYQGRQTPARLDAIALFLFTDTDRPHRVYPCLSSRVKAAASRHLVPILSSIFDDMRAVGNVEDDHISAMLHGLANVYEGMDTDEQMLSPQQLALVQDGMEACLQHYRWLHVQALTAAPRLFLWNKLPKHHYWQHLARQAIWQNPRWACCYQDEDFMGYLKTITQSSLAGTKCNRAVPTVLKFGRSV